MNNLIKQLKWDLLTTRIVLDTTSLKRRHDTNKQRDAIPLTAVMWASLALGCEKPLGGMLMLTMHVMTRKEQFSSLYFKGFCAPNV